MSLILLNQMAASGSNPNAWNISKAYYDVEGSGNPWTVIGVPPLLKGSPGTLGFNSLGLFFKPDGTKMYALDDGSGSAQVVNEYDLTTPWDTSFPSSLTFVQSFNVSAQNSNPTDLFFKPDGTKMYIIGVTDADRVFEYDLSTPWNISTTSYARSYVLIDTTDNEGLFFKPDGTKMYTSGTDTIREYDLSSTWNVSTASITANLSTGLTGGATGLSFKPDGTKMFFARLIGPSAGDFIEEYNLATPWSVSTASRFGTGAALGDISPRSVCFKPDGSMFFVSNGASDTVQQYLIGGKDFDVLAGQAGLNGLHFKPDGTKLYIVGGSPDRVNELSLSIPWNVSTSSNVRSYTVTQDASPADLFFRSDGTKLYVIGAAGDDVYEYDLSVAWDISTTSFVRSKSVGTGGGGETVPTGLFFKPDGTVMYITGSTTDRVIQYNLTSSWNIATASATGNGFFELVTGTGTIGAPQGLFFKSDGTKMYVAASGGNTNGLEEFSLSTPWDVTTATWVKSSRIELSGIVVTGIFFKPDGTQFWVSNEGTGTENRIFSYKISPT